MLKKAKEDIKESLIALIILHGTAIVCLVLLNILWSLLVQAFPYTDYAALLLFIRRHVFTEGERLEARRPLACIEAFSYSKL